MNLRCSVYFLLTTVAYPLNLTKLKSIQIHNITQQGGGTVTSRTPLKWISSWFIKMPFKRFSRMHNKLSELNAQNAHFGASLNRRDFTLSQYGTKLFGYSNKRKILSTSLESQYTVYCRGRCSKHNNQPTPLSA